MKEERREPNENDIKEMLDAFDRIASGDPDAELPDGARAFLKSIFEALDHENRELVSGDISLNPDAFRIFRRVAILLKNMKSSGLGDVDIIEDSPSFMPARIRFRSRGFVLSGEALDEFASCVEQSTSTEIYPETDGFLRVDFGIRNMWKKIDMGADDES